MTVPRLERTIAPESAPKRMFRPDVQGLRAIAVVVVILNHFAEWPTGGFVGVDVFFVISGFLITGLLLREHEKTGSISFLGFYKRRAKRILPAALMVIAATVAFTALFFTSQRAVQVLTDGLWAAFFAANWHFVFLGTDYFHANDAVSPLQHFWSLGVEEQFYLAWPWLMLAIFAITRASSMRQRAFVGALLAVLTAASFIWSLTETATAPAAAYFSTFSRAWELGAGALVALSVDLVPPMPPLLRSIVSWFGLACIAVSVFLIDDKFPWPSPWAALPVLGSVFVIVAGVGGYVPYALLLTNPLSRWLGDLSYSLYVWHFPLALFLGTLVPRTTLYFVVGTALILGVSALSYYFVEDPIRSGQFAWHRSNVSKAGRRRYRTGQPAFRFGYVVLAGLIALNSVLIPIAMAKGQASVEATGSDEDYSAAGDAPSSQNAPVTGIEGKVLAALRATTWPSLNPSVDHLGQEAYAPEWTKDNCLDVTEVTASLCVWGNASAPKQAVVLGDSDAVSWLPGIRKALQGRGYAVRSLTFGQCPAASVSVKPETVYPGLTRLCVEHNRWAAGQIQSIKPALVVTSTISNSIARLADNATGSAAMQEWQEGVERQLEPARRIGARVIILQAPPGGDSLQQCYSRLNSPSACVAPMLDSSGIDTATKAAASAIGATYVGTSSWFCYEGRCPSFVSDIPVYADGAHLTYAYSEYLASQLKDVLR